MMLKQLSNSHINSLIDEWINKKRRFIDGVIYERIAEEFDLSVTQVKTIIYKTKKELIKYL